ncbi:MAG: hypothetical protein DCC43_11130 [Candidatus Brocadia sp.]|nr:hypothetical protein [Anaerolineales bacterium]MCC6324635.1 hypothetical protein [Candidatus Brocadia sp.]MCE7912502.1 hypothetical protein [Candidatus Brocadia sp. AMX3]MDG5997227.1 hypothetical protein [Candidatus Brocadia sp.]RIJ96235.1 MAG: hypothetical protein DCC43_11130 [Candidatus Brocadia sp.]
MKNYLAKYLIFGSIVTLFSLSLFMGKLAQGQHAGGGIIDTTKQPGTSTPSFHQSFAPYGGTIPIPWIDEKPTPLSIKVTETITYEVPVDEKRFNEKKLTIEDLELKEVKDNTEINFHQVDCLFFKTIKQTQTRTVENLTCARERDGTQYWLSDGKKYVEWGAWSSWKVEKEAKGIEMAEKNP